MAPQRSWPVLLIASFLLAGTLHAQPEKTAAVSPETTATSRSKVFTIPFQSNVGSRLRALQLFYSLDQGRTWQASYTASPDQGAFPAFNAPADGYYWFAVRSEDLQGRFSPTTFGELRPTLKVLVDTQPPAIGLRPLPPQGSNVGVAWDVRDENLDLSKLHLEYRVGNAEQWWPLRINPTAVGEQFWTPMTNGQVEARLTARDAAGWVGQQQVVIPPGHSPGTVDPQNYSAPANPTVQLVNSKTISINYNLENVGPSGATVELWVTRDSRSWQKWHEVANVAAGANVIHLPVTAEGLYGVSLVVRSGAGLGGRPPQIGDAPQAWIEVDLTHPEVKNVTAEVNRSDIHNLVIRWQAKDKNLGRQCIAISYAEAPSSADQPIGQWVAITTSPVENTGAYIWQMPPSKPWKFLVRVEATDKAGNVGDARTDRPVAVDLQVPRIGGEIKVGAASK